MTAPSPTQWLIILAIVLLLFGATRLPKLARSLGESARIFKSEVKTMRDDDKPEDSDDDESPAMEGRVVDGGSTGGSTRGAQRDTAQDADRP